MKGASAFGLLVVCAVLAARELLPQPTGFVLFLALLVLELSATVVVVWIRMRLMFFAMGLICAIGALGALIYAEWRGFHIFYNLNPTSLTFSVLLAMAWLGWLVESKVSPIKWRRWSDFMRDKSLVDHLLNRHIPDLRSTNHHAEQGGA